MTDLWPDKLDDYNIKAPVTVLREQAVLLGHKTKNLIQAEVESGTNINGNFTYHFFIVAPTLNDYHYRLFTIEHEITLYPVLLYLGGELGQELGVQPVSQRPTNLIESMRIANEDIFRDMGFLPKSSRLYYVSVKSEDEFVEVLKTILNSQVTVHVISALLAQLAVRMEVALA